MKYLSRVPNNHFTTFQPLVAYSGLVLIILTAAFAYISYTQLTIRQSDPMTYFYAGLRITEVGEANFCDDNNEIAGPYFTLLGFKIRDLQNTSCFRPNLSIGFPLLIAATRPLGPVSETVHYITPILALVGLVTFYFLGKTLFDWPTGLLATGLLAFNSVFWTMATEIWSDVPALTFIILGMLLAVRAIEADDIIQGFISGAILGFACLIRYNSILVLLPFSMYFWFGTMENKKPKRMLVGFFSSFTLFILALMSYHQLYHGGWLKTSYSAHPGDVPWPRFSTSYFTGQTPIGEGGYQAILSAMMKSFHIIGLILACAGLIIMPRNKGLLLGTFILTFSIFYAFYAWPTEGINVRFLLPTFPAICLAIAFGITLFFRKLIGQNPILITALLLLITVTWHAPSIKTTQKQLERRNRYVENRVAQVQRFTHATPFDAVFMSREYHDLIILYGNRSALLYTLLANPDRNSSSSNYESRFVKVVDKLLKNNIPLFFVAEPEKRTFIHGDIDPYSILRQYFTIKPFKTSADLILYQVHKVSN